MNSANGSDHDQFAFASQLDVEEPETYARAMQGPNATHWAKAMKEKLDQLRKTKTWELMSAREIVLGHRASGEKWVYRVKQGVDGNIAYFKARWVVTSYLQ